jgi:alkanesulfonate monooxygenase SsuD/methylene tetrahydromethanopterin reductase-like flavin-dependent oxidoreductase (luciferase family)
MDMSPIPDYRRKLNILSEHCAAAGRNPNTIKKMIHFPGILAEDEREVRRQAEALAASWNTSVDDLRGRVLIGTPEQAAGQLWQYIELGAEHLVLSVQAPYDMRMIELFIGEVAPRIERMAYVS